MQVNNKKYHETGKQSGENKRFLGFAGCDIIKTEKSGEIYLDNPKKICYFIQETIFFTDLSGSQCDVTDRSGT